MNRQSQMQQQTVMSQQDTTPLKPIRSAHQNQFYQHASFSSHKSSAEKIPYVQQQFGQQQLPQTSTFQHQRAFSASQKQSNAVYLPVQLSVSPIKLPRNLSSDSASKLQPHKQETIHPPSVQIQQQQNNNNNNNNNDIHSNYITLSKSPYIVCNPQTVYYQIKNQSPSVQSQQQFQQTQHALNSTQRKGNINEESTQAGNTLSSQQKQEVLLGNQQKTISILQKSSDRVLSSNNYNHNSNQIASRNLNRTQNVIVQQQQQQQYQPQVIPSEQQQSLNGLQFSFQQQQMGQIFLNPGNSYHVQPLMKTQIQSGSTIAQGQQRGQKKESKGDNQLVDRQEVQNYGNMIIHEEVSEEEEQRNNQVNKVQKTMEDMHEQNQINKDNTDSRIIKLQEDNIQLIRLVEMLEKRIVEMTEASESAATTGRVQIESQRQEKQKFQLEAEKHVSEIKNLKEKEEQQNKQAEQQKQELEAVKEENAWLEEQLDVVKQQCVGLQEEKDHIQEQLQIAKKQLEDLQEEKNKSQKADSRIIEGDAHMSSYLSSMVQEKSKGLDDQRQKIDTLIKDRQEFEILVRDQKEVMKQLEETVQLLQLENTKLLEIIEVQNDISSAQHNNNQQHSMHQEQKSSQKILINAATGIDGEQQNKINEREQFNSNDYRIIMEMEAKLQDLADDNQRLGSSAEQFKQQAQYWKESYQLLQGQQLQEQQNQQQQQQQQQQEQSQYNQQQQLMGKQQQQLTQVQVSQQAQQIQQQQYQQTQQLQSQQESSQQQLQQLQQQQQQQQQQQSQQSSQQKYNSQQQVVYPKRQQNIQPTVVIQPMRNQIIQLVSQPQVLSRNNNPQQIKPQQHNMTQQQQQQQQPMQIIHPVRQSISNQLDDQRLQPTTQSPPRNQQPYVSNRSNTSPWNPNVIIPPQVVVNDLSHSWYNPAQSIAANTLKQSQQGYKITPTKQLPPAYAPPRRFASAEKQIQKNEFI